MKEDVLDVLLYLFQNYMSEEAEAGADREAMLSELQEAGFERREVNQALDWLDGLAARQQTPLAQPSTDRSVRIFTEEECRRLDVESRGLILYLEQSGVLSPEARELVMDRVLALETDQFDTTELKWIILMALFNQPGQETAYAWVEDLLFDDVPTYLH